MFTFLIVSFVKLVSLLVLHVLFAPFSLPELLLPSSFLDPVLGAIKTVVSLLIWLFGYGAYSFFIFTVITVVFLRPVLSFSYFVVHLFSRSKGLVK